MEISSFEWTQQNRYVPSFYLRTETFNFHNAIFIRIPDNAQSSKVILGVIHHHQDHLQLTDDHNLYLLYFVEYQSL